MWTYAQKTGVLARDGIAQGHGYSGAGGARNNPDAQRVKGEGPIPAGHYRIGPAYTHPRLGPLTMNLAPEPGTETFGRALFRIHGDNQTHDASHGCIVLSRPLRERIAQSGDIFLTVNKGEDA